MTLAIGGSSSAGNSTVGQLWVNVLDYGARADNGVTDNSGPIQAAIDALAAMMAGVNVASGIVYIPSATESYCVTKPIYLDSSNIEIRGDGAGSVVYMIGGAHPVFIVGVSRVATSYVNGVATPVSIGTANRPDCFGVLDKTAAAAAGTVWGLRTYNNTFVQFQGSAISAGAAVAGATSFSDNWGTTNQLTIEFCIEPPAGTQFQPYTPILGMGSLGQTGPVQASPFMVSTGYEANMIQMMFRTAEMQPLSVRVFDFLLGTATPPYRVAIQIDLVNAVYSAYVNGVQVAFNDVPPAFSPNLVFATNDFFPFMIGSFGPTATYTGTTGVDLSVYGLRLSNTLRYQNNGAGTKQTRADTPTTALTDSWAYFGNDAHTIAYLPGTDNPATAGRRVTVAHGGAAGYGPSSGLFINAVAPTYSSGNTFRDLYIQCGTGYGAGILVGTVLELTIEDVKIASGYYGIGSFNSTVNYFVRMARCDLMGTDSAYYSAFQISWARDITFSASGRATVRHFGSAASWDNVFVENVSPITECAFKASAAETGGNFSLSNWKIDYEGGAFSRSVFYCEAHAINPCTSLDLRNIGLGTIGANSSVIQLKDTGTQSAQLFPCWLNVDNIQAYTTEYLAAVDVDGPLWRGKFNGVGLTGPRLYHRQLWGTTTGVEMEEANFTAPPRELYWYTGAPVLEVRSPVEGQFAEWRCVNTGTYGTATPPTWAGLNPLHSTSNGLAAYVLNNGYITVVLT